jgi:DNA-binding IscR family transcriptional regulator
MLKFELFCLIERPLLVKADIRPGGVSANRPKADIRLLWVVRAANGPTATLDLRPLTVRFCSIRYIVLRNNKLKDHDDGRRSFLARSL